MLIGALVTWRIRKENTPEEYTPGEASKDITSALSRPAAQPTPLPPQTVKNTVSSRVVDRLVDPGRNLPPEAPEPRFTDVTNASGLSSFRQFQGPRTSQLPEDMGSGVAWGDFDNDGLDDLFVVSGGGPLGAPVSQLAPSVLYRNLGDGRFEKVEDFSDLRIHGMGAAWGDYNNDGWLDLVVTGYDTIILFRNELARINPQNHRAFQRKGELLAASVSSRSQLELERQSLEAALRLNSEETGTLVLLGQVALAEGDLATADQRFAHACQANPRAVNV